MSAKIHFRDYNPKQTILFPQRLDKDIAENDPVRVVDTVIDNLKLEYFRKLYKERGRSPYHPKMMLKAVIYGYMNNLYSCRKIESSLKRDIHFIWLAGYEQPDFNTINRFRNRVKEDYRKLPDKVVADSGYGSEENYRFMDEAGITAYVKYNWFHQEQRKHYEPNPFSPQSLYYNAEGDYYVCPMGQHMERIGTTQSKTGSGYVTESACYKAQRCEGCPLRGSCFKAKGDRTIEVNHRLNEYRRKARERLTSEAGIKHRGQRCIEPEAVFGQMKYDMAYKRFRHFGFDKVKMDFAFFAIAFNDLN